MSSIEQEGDSQTIHDTYYDTFDHSFGMKGQFIRQRTIGDASTGFVQWETKSVEQPPPLQTHRLLNTLPDKENMDILLSFTFDRKFYVFKDIE